jgi:hypothetical protein
MSERPAGLTFAEQANQEPKMTITAASNTQIFWTLVTLQGG